MKFLFSVKLIKIFWIFIGPFRIEQLLILYSILKTFSLFCFVFGFFNQCFRNVVRTFNIKFLPIYFIFFICILKCNIFISICDYQSFIDNLLILKNLCLALFISLTFFNTYKSLYFKPFSNNKFNIKNSEFTSGDDLILKQDDFNLRERDLYYIDSIFPKKIISKNLEDQFAGNSFFAVYYSEIFVKYILLFKRNYGFDYNEKINQCRIISKQKAIKLDAEFSEKWGNNPFVDLQTERANIYFNVYNEMRIKEKLILQNYNFKCNNAIKFLTDYFFEI